MRFLFSKSKTLLKQALGNLAKKKKTLTEFQYQSIYSDLESFQRAILAKDTEKTLTYFKTTKKLFSNELKLSSGMKLKEFVISIILALIAAVIIRQMWFELFQIPSGSMRPTFKEADRLTVTKPQFGINIPLTPGHFYFDPALVKRNMTITFTGEDMDIEDGKTLYFYLFPGYKQYVKRLIGKPGDLLYFYGGKIYGKDKDGIDISNELNPPELSHVDHIPYINFEGIIKTGNKNQQGVFSPITLYQMNLPIAKMQAIGSFVKSEVVYTNGKPIQDYYEVFGMGHYGMCRIVKKDRYYLEIQHHPSFKGAKVQQDLYRRMLPTLNLSKSFIPLDEEHLKRIFNNLYTSRFVVKDGFIKRSSQDSPPLGEAASHIYPKLLGIPDGCYEYDQGKAYQIYFQGISKQLKPSHPLLQYSKENAVFFFNYGIEFNLIFSPESPYKLFPSRYAYFRDGDLYILGTKIFDKTDKDLVEFVTTETSRLEKNKDYAPFIDGKVPIAADGTIDGDFLNHYGFKIPDGHYLALGDNHAVSADSRRFGCVPEANLRGMPDVIFFPPGSRTGHPLQPAMALVTTPRVIVWLLAATGFGIYYFVSRKTSRFPFKF